MFKIKTYNAISPLGLEQFPNDLYQVGTDIKNPDAIILRSHDMHAETIPDSVTAIGRAGAGVNNIPVEKFSHLGIPVFNAPGANANAVKELVLTGMFLACRNICNAWQYTKSLDASDAALAKQIEAGKKQFKGYELPGKVLGVIGLGAIGTKIANAASTLGMHVVGFDPSITVTHAWELSSDVKAARSLKELLQQSDFITIHIPLNDKTQHFLNAENLQALKQDAVILNFARDEIIDEQAVLQLLNDQRIGHYVTDFPTTLLKDHEKVIALPHLGASTIEAEDNCAVMVAKQVRDYLENAHITNAVNFPDIFMPRNGSHRLAIANANVPNMVGQISTLLAEQNLNINDLINKSKGDVAFTLIDLNDKINDKTKQVLQNIEGVLKVRVLYNT